mmetsp:Transcript_11661/g.28292  ORF Transcript_11661/g.28292 Transcript_11661/m.28292 type:complete len:223 (+) Transcript_11661:125-793(+)
MALTTWTSGLQPIANTGKTATGLGFAGVFCSLQHLRIKQSAVACPPDKHKTDRNMYRYRRLATSIRCYSRRNTPTPPAQSLNVRQGMHRRDMHLYPSLCFRRTASSTSPASRTSQLGGLDVGFWHIACTCHYRCRSASGKRPAPPASMWPGAPARADRRSRACLWDQLSHPPHVPVMLPALSTDVRPSSSPHALAKRAVPFLSLSALGAPAISSLPLVVCGA